MLSKMGSVFLGALLAAVCVAPGCQKAGERSDNQPRAVSEVLSTQLTGTTIVPTLDTPLAKSGNAVWCAAFQVAWNQARDDVIGAPLRITNAQSIAKRLNHSSVTKAALPPGSYYAAAGRLEDGIIETIHSQMSRRFPRAKPPSFDGAVGFVTYAYLDTKATFTTPFVDAKQPIRFSDGAGVVHSVDGFGLHEGTDWDLLEKQAAQVKVLYSQSADESEESKLTNFALDLAGDQAENELIIAVLPRAKHLRAALDDLARRIENASRDRHSAKMYETDTLAIPNVAFNLHHEFPELQGIDKRIENKGEFQDLYIAKAWQSINFRLDKSGASVISESGEYAAAIPRDFIVDRPFLIVMKRRTAAQPYFVAWIDDAELLEANR